MDTENPYSTNANIRFNEIYNNIAKLFDILMRNATIQQTATMVNEIKGEYLVLMFYYGYYITRIN